MNLALKEWESVVNAIGSGLQICLLRKGGIIEADRGGFQLREREFLLFPTYEHEHLLMLKEQHKGLMRPGCAGEIQISLLTEVTDVIQASSFEQLRRAEPHYIWNERFLTKRLEYKPELPLYCILLRAFRLPTSRCIPDRPSYAGCKSWVHLTEEIDTTGAIPVLSDQEYERERARLLSALR